MTRRHNHKRLIMRGSKSKACGVFYLYNTNQLYINSWSCQLNKKNNKSAALTWLSLAPVYTTFEAMWWAARWLACTSNKQILAFCFDLFAVLKHHTLFRRWKLREDNWAFYTSTWTSTKLPPCCCFIISLSRIDLPHLKSLLCAFTTCLNID